MASEELKCLTSRNLQELVKSNSLQTPITAFELLARFISLPVVSPENGVNFRLTDLRKLEVILEQLADNWDAGSLSVLRDSDGGLSVMQIQLESIHSEASKSRKRKRYVDEDADSAEEEEASKAEANRPKSTALTSLSNLSKDMQEIYALLQRGTARHRLLTEQVCHALQVLDLYPLTVRIVSIHKCSIRAHLSSHH